MRRSAEKNKPSCDTRGAHQEVARIRALLIISTILDVVGELERLGDEGLDLVGKVLLLAGVLEVGGVDIINVVLELISSELKTLEVGAVDDLEEANRLTGHDAARVDEAVPAVLEGTAAS